MRSRVLSLPKAGAFLRMERFSLPPPLVMQLSLADLIAYQVPLTPREAASLTLAVAEQWECWCAHHHHAGSLPSPNAIVLHQSGTVSFVASAPADPGDRDAALSSLLSGLLGLEEDRACEQKPFAYPAALRHAVAHTEGARGSEAFRTALMRFAAADPVILRSVFWRAVRIIQGATTPRPPVSFDARRRARGRTERRKRGIAVSDLRREIRLLEQQIYESRAHRTRMTTARIARPKLALGVATACSLVVVTISLARTAFTPEHSQSNVSAERVDTALPAPAAAVVPPRATRVAAVASPRRGPVRATRVAARSRLASRPLVSGQAPIRRPPATTGFAGGTRGVVWAMHAP